MSRPTGRGIPFALAGSSGTTAPSRLASIERRAGRLLRVLRDRDLLRRFGNVRLGDYVIERLGVSYRTAQEWIRVDEALERLPAVAAAFDAGEIGSAKVRLLTRVATGEDEARWVALARRLDVRGLARAVAERERAGGTAKASARAGAGAPGRNDEIQSPSPGEGAKEDRFSREGPVVLTGAEDEEERLASLEMSVPAWLASSWRDAVVLARQLAGEVMSRGECFEMVVAELLGSLMPPGEPPGECPGAAARESAKEDGGESARSEVRDGPGRRTSETVEVMDGPERCDANGVGGPVAGGHEPVAELPRNARAGTDEGGPDLLSPRGEGGRADRTGLPGSASVPGSEKRGSRQMPCAEPASVTAATKAEARAIDKELRELMASRQKREWALAERLHGAAMLRSYRLDGFASLEEYARERLGLSPRGTYRLLALHRTLERLPALRRSFLSGRVTLRQALVIGSVATVVTERAWIGRARAVTLRRLEDEVCFWKHLKEVRPSVWDLLEGYPLPAGIVLVPGRPARLSTSARRSLGADGCHDPEGGASGGSYEHSWAGPDHLDQDEEPDLPTRARARTTQLTAEALLQALEDSEGALPLPEHRVCLRLRVEPEVKSLWEGAVARCRSTIGETIADWEVLALALAAFWKTWDNSETRRQRREHRTIARDGWRCMAPGCWSMGTGRLHEHHIIFKSHGGALTDPRNVIAACTQHHKRLLHEGFIRCTGDAPDDVVWSFGVEEGQEPFLVYHGETRIGGTAV